MKKKPIVKTPKDLLVDMLDEVLPEFVRKRPNKYGSDSYTFKYKNGETVDFSVPKGTNLKDVFIKAIR